MSDYTSQFAGAEIDARLAKVPQLESGLAQKQDTLQSGVNIKTINGESIVGTGNIVAGDPNAVKYTAQTLTDAQKAQARTNIAAASAAELGQIVTDLTGIEADIDSLEAAIEAINVGDYVTATALPTASASTMGHIYLIGPDANNNYDRYFTQESGGTYSWVSLGSTQIDLSTYATQEELSQLEHEVNDLEVDTSEDSDLDIIDENAYSIVRFKDGHIKTKNFDSTDMSKNTSDSSDFDIIDEEGYSIARFENGHIKTKNFDSENIEIDTENFEKNYVQKDLNIFFNSVFERQHYDTVSETTENLSFPYDLKKNICFAMKAEFSSFATVMIGKGYNAYSGYWFVVDATSISLYYNQGSTVLSESVPHGLVFSDFVKIVISNMGDEYCRFFIQTRDAQFAYMFKWIYAANGQAFLTTAGTLTNVDFIASCSDLKNDIWVFGDSYLGFNSPARWPYQLRMMGYSDFLGDGLAGQNSSGAYSDLQRCLALGVKPKYLVWTLGMNDTDSAWNTTYQQVQTLCESNDITLILATIPTVPIRNNENKNTTIRNSGYDYIDFAKAVGANSSGVWYNGYLSSDNVHPTELGAKALATQFIFDFILKH